jgi:hypothetical protein
MNLGRTAASTYPTRLLVCAHISIKYVEFSPYFNKRAGLKSTTEGIPYAPSCSAAHKTSKTSLLWSLYRPNPDHTITTSICNIHFSTIPPSMCTSIVWSVSLSFPSQNDVHIYFRALCSTHLIQCQHGSFGIVTGYRKDS